MFPNILEIVLFQVRQPFIPQHSGPLLIHRDTFQGPQWTPETTNSTEPYIYYIFSYTYIPKIKFNL